ncbi:MAG: hypothetical protein MUC48_02500 [Leptolyngbya sp. Prado105]|jgi:hypothetical protein|nr:hypothetical protein [Leptolyngbya sp. Prado105]
MNTKKTVNGTNNGNGSASPTSPSLVLSDSSPTSSDSDYFSPSDREEALKLLMLLREVLPPLRDLTVEERRSLPGMGDANRTFAGKVLEVILQNSDFLPRTFDLDRYQNQLETFDNLSAIARRMTQLSNLINATMTAIGSEVHDSSLTVYRYAKASGQGASLDAAKAEMKQRFTSNSKGKKKEKDAEKPEADE